MRERDQVRAGTLRMALTAVTNEEVAGTEHASSPTTTCSRCSPRRPRSGARPRRPTPAPAAPSWPPRRTAELAVLETYLPDAARRRRARARSSREAVAATGRDGHAADGPGHEGRQAARRRPRRGWPGRRRRPQACSPAERSSRRTTQGRHAVSVGALAWVACRRSVAGWVGGVLPASACRGRCRHGLRGRSSGSPRAASAWRVASGRPDEPVPGRG